MMKGEKSLVREDTSELGLTVSICDAYMFYLSARYFGRAKELPGVKELFTRSTQQATEESARTASFQMFRHQGPDYYGDEDELDKELVDSEDAEAREGTPSIIFDVFTPKTYKTYLYNSMGIPSSKIDL